LDGGRTTGEAAARRDRSPTIRARAAGRLEEIGLGEREETAGRRES
jgi:hypothetical protein